MEYEFVELKQRHIEAWSRELPKADETPVPVYNGALVRAAIKAGWFLNCKEKPEDVNDWPPVKVRNVAVAIMREYARVMDISPE